MVIKDARDSNQFTFIKGKQTLDGILIANEYVDASRRKQKDVVVKIDVEKVYDKTEWDFLDYVMARNGSIPNRDHGCLGVFPLLIARLF